MVRTWAILLTVGMSTAVITTSAWADPPQKPSHVTGFALSQKTHELIPEVQSSIVNAVAERFGDPSQPIIPTGLPVKVSVVQGQKVYLMHCARCHGISGDGAGVKSKEMEPKPRDFRSGQFKWKSTLPPNKPLRHDLRETVRLGIPGTAMPSFADLSEQDGNGVVDYVRWLAMVGEFEIGLAIEFNEFSMSAVDRRVAKGEKRTDIAAEAADDMKKLLFDAATEVLQLVQEKWTKSELESSIVRPKFAAQTDEASVQRGRELYVSQKTKCDVCHGPNGKGDGRATKDFWRRPESGENYREPGLHDYWGHVNQPWDLSTGRYRGGNSPEDLYRRIYAGIGGTAMPAYGGVVLNEAELWDLVNYVRSLHPEKPNEQLSNPRQPPPDGNRD